MLTDDELMTELEYAQEKLDKSKARFETTHEKYDYFNLAYWLGRKQGLELIIEGVLESECTIEDPDDA